MWVDKAKNEIDYVHSRFVTHLGSAQNLWASGWPCPPSAPVSSSASDSWSFLEPSATTDWPAWNQNSVTTQRRCRSSCSMLWFSNRVFRSSSCTLQRLSCLFLQSSVFRSELIRTSPFLWWLCTLHLINWQSSTWSEITGMPWKVSEACRMFQSLDFQWSSVGKWHNRKFRRSTRKETHLCELFIDLQIFAYQAKMTNFDMHFS